MPNFETPPTPGETKKENIENIIPQKYKGLTSEVVEELWSITEYVDQKITEEQKERKRKVIEYLRKKEEAGGETTSGKTENQAAKDVKLAFESMAENFGESVKEKIKEYDERIRAVLAGKPIKKYDKIKDLKKDFKQLSRKEWTEDFDVNSL